MTFTEATAAMDAGKWVRRKEWIFMGYAAIPGGWAMGFPDNREWKNGDYFEVYATMATGELWPQIMGPTIFNEEDKAATDWEPYEPPTGHEN